MPMWCQFGWYMSSSNLISLMTLIWNLPLNFDVAFCNWLDKFLSPTMWYILYYLMSTNKSISYILCNKSIIVNLYKLYFLSSHFSFQPNKRIFYPPTFPPSHFSTLPTKHIWEKTKSFLSSHFSILPLIFYPSTFPLLQPNGPLW